VEKVGKENKISHEEFRHREGDVFPRRVKFISSSETPLEYAMSSMHKKERLALSAFMVLFTIFGIPIMIALPFLIWGFIGRM
jgi:hypothetical protein